jgi:hypothetical protein
MRRDVAVTVGVAVSVALTVRRRGGLRVTQVQHVGGVIAFDASPPSLIDSRDARAQV